MNDIDPRFLDINARIRQAQQRGNAAARRVQDGDFAARADMIAASRDIEAARLELRQLIDTGAIRL